MIATPILTISIPTFNRLKFLKPLIEALSELNLAARVEILVLDNFSSDGTWEWLSENKSVCRLTLRRNPYNLGIEGNILQALIHATGTYVWLMSDHMLPRIEEIKKLINFLSSEDGFTVGYARIMQYDTVMPSTYKRYVVSELTLKQRGHLLLNLSNISAVIVHRELIRRSIRSGFRFSKFTYPHLGLLVGLSSEDKIIEFPIVSEFQTASGKSYGNSYDTFKSRFVGFPEAIHSLSYLNPLLGSQKNAIMVRGFMSALKYELFCRFVISSTPLPEFKDLFVCVRIYPMRIKFLFVAVILLKGLPRSVNAFLMKWMMKFIAPGKYIQCVKSQKRACSSVAE